MEVMRRPKSSWVYAQEIAALPTRAERERALAAVPADWQALVRETVESAFAVRAARRGRSGVPTGRAPD